MSTEESTLIVCNLINETFCVNNVKEDDAISGMITLLINYMFEKGVSIEVINLFEDAFQKCIAQCKMNTMSIDLGKIDDIS